MEFLNSLPTRRQKQGDWLLYQSFALARSSKSAALALLGPKKGCTPAHDFGIFCARAHFRKSQNLPKRCKSNLQSEKARGEKAQCEKTQSKKT